MTTSPTQSENWREAYEAYLDKQKPPRGWLREPYLALASEAFRAGYLAAQPKRPSVEEVARVIADEALCDVEKCTLPHCDCAERSTKIARAILSLIFPPETERT